MGANEHELRARETANHPARRSRNRLGVRGLVRAFGRRLVAAECEQASTSRGPLDAALLSRRVAKAAKAATSHRTPNLAACFIIVVWNDVFILVSIGVFRGQPTIATHVANPVRIRDRRWLRIAC